MYDPAGYKEEAVHATSVIKSVCGEEQSQSPGPDNISCIEHSCAAGPLAFYQSGAYQHSMETISTRDGEEATGKRDDVAGYSPPFEKRTARLMRASHMYTQERTQPRLWDTKHISPFEQRVGYLIKCVPSAEAAKSA